MVDSIEVLRNVLRDPETSAILGSLSDSWVTAEREGKLEEELASLGGGRDARDWALLVAVQFGVESLVSTAIDVLGPVDVTRVVCGELRMAAPGFRWAMA